MTNEEAARILDPATSEEALRPYALDCVMRMAMAEEASRLGAAALRERQRWIPVKERLPEHGERVLAYCKDRVIHDVKWSWTQNDWSDKVTGNRYFESFVTHWMPLPKPPEVE